MPHNAGSVHALSNMFKICLLEIAIPSLMQSSVTQHYQNK